MVSHDKSDTFSVSMKGGARFKKRASPRNVDIGKCMEGKPGPAKGRYDTAFQAEFRTCVGKAGKYGPAKKPKAKK